MNVTSDSFQDGDYLAQQHILSSTYGFGCAGGNASPHLAWSDVPVGTRSDTYYRGRLEMELPLGAGSSNGDTLPAGALQVRTDFGAPGYGGPCPPKGDYPHRYLFTVHAVSQETLPVTADTAAAVVGFHLNFNTLAKGAIMGLCKT